MERYKAISVLERFLKIDLFGPGTFRVLMSTPTMKDLLGIELLKAAAGCNGLKQRSKRTGGWNRSTTL